MNDLEEDLSRSLAATAATTDTHVERLLDQALTTGTRYRHRRRMLAGTGTALAAGLGVALLVGTVGLGLPGPGVGAGIRAGASGQPSGSPRPSLTWQQQYHPPLNGLTESFRLADGEPSALQAPDEVGDPRYLHASFDPGPLAGKAVEWGSYGDFERLSVHGDNDFELTLATSTRDMGTLQGKQNTVTVSGHSARYAAKVSGATELSKADFLHSFFERGPGAALRWQPAPGLWAQLVGDWSATTAQHIAEQLRFDRTYVCPASFQVGNPLANAHTTSCEVDISGGAVLGARTEIAIGSWNMAIETGSAVLTGNPSVSETLGGHPAYVYHFPGDDGHDAMQVLVDYLADGTERPVGMVTLLAEGAYDAATVRAIAGNLQLVTDPDPAHWPANPLP